MKLFTPGPVEVDPKILKEISKPVMAHRSQEFREVLSDVVEKLIRILGLENGHLAVLSGSGTTAVDAMVWSLMSPGDRVLALVHGEFGRRAISSAEVRGAEVEAMEAPLGKSVEPELVRRRIEIGKYTHLLLVHNETSTGVAYRDLKIVAESAKDRGMLVLVDSVSGLGGEELRMSEWHLDAVASCSHKALASPPGVSFVALSGEAAGELRDGLPPILDLRRYLDFYTRRRETPFTPAVNNLCALRKSLEHIMSMGIDAYIELHRRKASLLYEELPKLGFLPLPDEPVRSNTVTVFRTPGLNAKEVVSLLIKKGFRIASGMKDKAEHLIRIGTMGNTSLEDLRDLIGSLNEVVGELSGQRTYKEDLESGR